MFLSQSEIRHVFIQVEPVDFRKGIVGLAAMIDHEDRGGKSLFAFVDRTKRKIKILYWDETGFAMWSKILDAQKFYWPKRVEDHVELSVQQLSWLLDGVDIDAVKTHKKSLVKSFF
jgi:transposase